MGEIAAEAVDTCRFVQKQGHGTVHRCVRLKGPLTLPSGASAQPWLCQTAQGVWIAGSEGDVGVAIDLLAAHPSSYQERLLGDQLAAGLLRFSVPYGRGREARDAIALGRLLRDATHPVYSELPSPSGPWVDECSRLDQVWMAAQIAPDDPILVWLHTGTPATMDGALSASPRAAWRLLITRDRAQLVAISTLGDVAELPLATVPLEVIEQTGRNEVVCGSAAWQTTLGNGARFLDIATLTGLNGEARLREAARVAARPGTTAGHALSERILASLREEEHALDGLYKATLAARASDSKEPAKTAEDLVQIATAAVAALRESADDSTSLTEWLLGWSPPLDLAQAVLGACLREGDSSAQSAWSLDYHHALRNRIVGESSDRFVRTEADIALAEHLLYAGEEEAAARLLEPRLASLPDEDLATVVPPPDAVLTKGEGGQPAHIRVLELLVLARGGPDRADVSALASLARHQPLVKARLEALVEATAGGNLGHRAQRALDMLEPAGLRAPPIFSGITGAGAAARAGRVPAPPSHPGRRGAGAHPVRSRKGAAARLRRAPPLLRAPSRAECAGRHRRRGRRLHHAGHARRAGLRQPRRAPGGGALPRAA